MRLTTRDKIEVPNLFERADDSSSNCLTCDTVPDCPTCDSGEQCALTTQTCTKCPETYCVKTSSLSGSDIHNGLTGAEVAGIAGALSGVVFLVIIAGFYLFWKKYRHKFQSNSKYNAGEELKSLARNGELGNFSDDEDAEIDYNSKQQKRMSQATLSTMANSVFTKASNVINVAYIPGVTARPQMPASSRISIGSKANSSYSKETYFSDLENASFHGGQVASKAFKPSLVQFNKDDYNFDQAELPQEKLPRANFGNFSFRFQKSGMVNGMQGDIIEEEEDDEHDYTIRHESSGKVSPQKPRLLTRYGSLREKNQPFGLNSGSSSSEESDSDSDSDEENIEYITKKHQEGKLDLDSFNLPSSMGSTLKSDYKNTSSSNNTFTGNEKFIPISLEDNPFNSSSE